MSEDMKNASVESADIITHKEESSKEEEKVRALGIEHIYTWTSGPRNPRFYERHGYRAFTVFENFYEIEGYHQTGFRRDLAPLKEDGHDLI